MSVWPVQRKCHVTLKSFVEKTCFQTADIHINYSKAYLEGKGLINTA